MQHLVSTDQSAYVPNGVFSGGIIGLRILWHLQTEFVLTVAPSAGKEDEVMMYTYTCEQILTKGVLSRYNPV